MVGVKGKKAKSKKKKLKVYKGRYFVAGKNKVKAEAVVERVSDSEDKIVLLHPQKETTLATARRVVLKDRKPLRITPKRPKLKR